MLCLSSTKKPSVPAEMRCSGVMDRMKAPMSRRKSWWVACCAGVKQPVVAWCVCVCVGGGGVAPQQPWQDKKQGWWLSQQVGRGSNQGETRNRGVWVGGWVSAHV